MTAVARLFCGSTRRITLDDEQFAQVWIALLAVGQLAREVRYIQSPLTPGQFARLSRSFAGGGSFCDFLDDAPGFARMFFEPLTEPFVNDRFDDWPDLRRN